MRKTGHCLGNSIFIQLTFLGDGKIPDPVDGVVTVIIGVGFVSATLGGPCTAVLVSPPD